MKIGIIASGEPQIPKWIDNLIKTVNNQNNIQISFLRPEQSVINNSKKFIFLNYLEEKLFNYQVRKGKRINNNTYVDTTERFQYLEIESLDFFDVVLVYGMEFKYSGSYPKYGIWTYYIGGERIEESYSGLSEQSLYQSLSLKIVSEYNKDLFIIADTKIKSARLFVITRNNIMAKLAELTIQTLKKIQYYKIKEMDKFEHSGTKYTCYNYMYLISYKNAIIQTINKKFKKQTEWHLLTGKSEYIPNKTDELHKIRQSKDVFWADPFFIDYKNDRYIFVEEYPFNSRKGVIAVLQKFDNYDYRKIGIALEREYHLSYPFLFNYENNLFMIPETSSNKAIELYICKEFPLKWSFEKKMIDNIIACDTTLLNYNNTWWMFTSVSKNGWGFDEQLYLFYCDNPILDEWIEHPMNPIVLDTRYSRMAGNIFEYDGKLIRPTQDCMREYGDLIHYMEIKNLTKSFYEEVLYTSTHPSNDYLGTHTFNKIGNEIVFDVRMIKK